ncbi:MULTISPECIES: AEC family transporter [unclassified Clostridioides]|uniref:AEC family transporter n=1 Tax=unclassified Clostridioides TaxID=2635829 RepID=UPI001D11B87B|nr:AEC family transporter [Clostridioides sp. ZZV15-6388]MCC0643436.1 AEC family transporter [Clostridioides sp. ZZV14-6150]MCC0664395.1 AEC family transporter [Clostridioides sp. ZZV15-6597]MCC0668793.1 AEC family transporter [Clostridioides sp. ZZV14-6153]MCC0718481.1 AEC family transporter [Clostridioides sp. ZZV14-6105]MCC0727158.1 AEC family transporter [Clostridioides sp. ZZV14-6045]MCC0733612.1 AEC family transporter [Clostridioides sp. ZZV14-6009]MCC0738338.1 AEC family transporter [
MNFSNIFIQVAVLFIIILVGYFVRKFNLLDEHCTSKLSNLTMTIFLPSMIISSMQINFDNKMIQKILLLLFISLVMYIVSIIIAFLLKYILKCEDAKDLGIYQYIVVFSNVAFMGYPVIEAVLGHEAIFYTAIFNLPFNLFSFTLGIYLLSKGSTTKGFSMKSLISPATIAVVIGLFLFITGLRLPQFINDPLKMLGNMTTPISMIIIGSLLANSSAIDCFVNKRLYLVTIVRLLVLPVIIYFILKGWVNDKMILAIPVVISSMPAAANTAIFANQYDSNVTLASQCVFFTTLFSIISIPFISIFLLS